ncbi:MAG: hypothetical protein JSV73_09320 [Flavobacteriaceae bacterium]|nr:MAG: hypothetical protein JSV73_09320 [Flavobacteriaceae bacterium]
MNSKEHTSEKKPPMPSRGILSDIANFFIKKPKYDTFIKFDSSEERYQYNNRIIQRIGIDSDQYSVLNINKIGIDAPVNNIFNELVLFDGNPRCWPNHIAKVDRINNDFKNIRMLPFGWKRYPFKSMKSFLGLPLIPLFLLKAVRVKDVPDNFDFDNARYVLYECSGGYPIGFLAIYVRSSIPEMGETSKSQLVFGVGFNFFGRKEWQGKRKFISSLWEAVHNRVTANVLNRIKQLSEWRVENLLESANNLTENDSTKSSEH